MRAHVPGDLVTHEPLRREDITTPLVPESSDRTRAAPRRRSLFAPLELELDELAPQKPERARAVLMLAALRTSDDDDPRRKVPHPDRRRDLVDVLSAGPAGAHRGHLEIVVANLDGNRVVDIDQDLDRDERRLSPIAFAERAHAHEPVDAGLAPESAVHAGARDPERGAVDPRSVSFLSVELLDDEPPPRRPAEVHPQEHGREVLGVDAARARLNGHDRAHAPVRLGRRARALGRSELDVEGVEIGFGRSERVHVAFVEGEQDEPMRIVERALGVRDPIVQGAETCSLREELFRTFAVAPEVGLAEEEVEFGEASRLPGEVKDRRGAG